MDTKNCVDFMSTFRNELERELYIKVFNASFRFGFWVDDDLINDEHKQTVFNSHKIALEDLKLFQSDKNKFARLYYE